MIITVFGVLVTATVAIQQSAAGSLSVEAAVGAVLDCAKPCMNEVAASYCGTRGLQECVCNDHDFRSTAVDCFRGACSTPDIFASLRGVDVVCENPRRDRRMEAWPYISIHIFGILCAIARVYTKAFVIRKFSPEDWLALTYFIIYIVYFGIGHHALMSAFGQDIWWVEAADLRHALMLFFIDVPVYSLLLGLTKISIILFYIRLCHLYTIFCRVCWAFMFAVGANTLILMVLAVFQCSPIRWNWDRFGSEMIEPKCLDLNALSWAVNITNIIFDVVVLALPIPLVIHMKSTFRRKLAIIFMFSLGIVVLVASCLKMRYNILYGHSSNITWDYMDLMVWAGIESSVSVAAPCLPTVRLLLHSKCPHLFGRWFAFGSQGERTLDEYIKAEEEEVAQWSADVEKPQQVFATVVRPRRAVVRGLDGRPFAGMKGVGEAQKAMTEASRILRSLDDNKLEEE